MLIQSEIANRLRILVGAALLLPLWCVTAYALPTAGGDVADMPPLLTTAAARTCKQVSTCEQAVRLWCGGYGRADADKDGIPCENVCRTKEQVDAIRSEIGC